MIYSYTIGPLASGTSMDWYKAPRLQGGLGTNSWLPVSWLTSGLTGSQLLHFRSNRKSAICLLPGGLGARFAYTIELRGTQDPPGFVLPVSEIIPSGQELWAAEQVVYKKMIQVSSNIGRNIKGDSSHLSNTTKLNFTSYLRP